MRIAMLSWESLHSIPVGGVGTHVTELAAALERRGHEVHVLTRVGPRQAEYDRIHGVHYQRVPYPGHRDFVDDINNMCRAMVDRFFILEKMTGPFDVVHAHDWLTASALIGIKQGRPKQRCLLTVHSTEYGRCGNVFHNGRSQRIREQERAGTCWADRIIAVSKALQAEIGWMYDVPAGKTRVVYNGVSPHRFDLAVDPGEFKRRVGIAPMDPMILFCGRLVWQKGPDLLLEAVPAALRCHGGAKFVIAGEGDMRGGLEQRARKLGVSHAMRFIGPRSGDDLVRFYKVSDAVCVPSRNEPFGIVVLEAWSAGKPVIVSEAGGPNEFVTHEVNGLKIYPRPDSVAWGLSRIFADFERGRQMGANGRREVEARFTWDRIAGDVLAVYDEGKVAPVAPAPPVRLMLTEPPVDADRDILSPPMLPLPSADRLVAQAV
jgi:glycogen synthase